MLDLFVSIIFQISRNHGPIYFLYINLNNIRVFSFIIILLRTSSDSTHLNSVHYSFVHALVRLTFPKLTCTELITIITLQTTRSALFFNSSFSYSIVKKTSSETSQNDVKPWAENLDMKRVDRAIPLS